jgi:folate-binding protein YgfZ
VTPAPRTTGPGATPRDDTPDGWLHLPDIAVVRARGGAVRPFLGRQLTCDVEALAPHRPLLGAWLTSKGRVLSLLNLVELDDASVLLLLPAALAPDLLARMRMYVLREDVVLESDPQLQVVGLSGRAARDCIAQLTPGTLPAPVPLSRAPELSLLVGSATAVQSVAERLGHRVLDTPLWCAALIRAGLPAVDLNTRESFIPQMLNLDRLDAVSFTKGCYPGQEIVARTQHLGRIKRRMFVARGELGDGLAQPGEAIAVDGALDAPGRVVLAARDGPGQILLAVLPLDAVAAGAVFRLAAAHGPVLAISPPPYPLDVAAP